MAKPADIIDIGFIASELERRRNFDGPNTSFDGIGFEDLILMLAQTQVIAPQLSEVTRRRLCADAVFDAGRRGVITRASLQASLSQATSALLDRPPLPYIVATSISVPFTSSLRPIRLATSRIRFSPHLPRRFDRSRFNLGSLLRESEGRGYAVVRVLTKARFPEEAFDQASSDLDFVRGAWNFALRRNVWEEHASYSQPFNDILPGPLQTLHHPNGQPADDAHWYDPFFNGPRLERPSSDKWELAYRQLRQIRRAVRAGAFGHDLRLVLIRYCRALDSRDPQSAFLQLWSVLETLTATNRYTNNIQSTAFLYHDPQLVRYALECLREQRNTAVHQGSSSDHRRDHLVMLHRYVADCLAFALGVCKFFHNLEEMGSFLRLPSDKTALQRAIQLRNKALRFKGHTGPRSSCS